ncbi:uncharacterized protein L969DRAFT_93264 [Mixia osmundae IAM 14324]|uniref:CRA domain-containing protein n=1 Tax=Mixia osmundae (strain CBS 9802 / IAM 14324 / JCM 22182 / KY 12970) TaxID=764103 RepID=G7E5L4_MIXOS|nr:uncharacterized protein L969DRAFT_93264 [Mixia osmundae IAM 14324]KEI40728.1 hypothetical protein L969DRAFT_93264 [Mixia osmundae IAM 14324]GAA98124.1 hypothetical protein E5Q_04807 [Mixia osmundae IAM 14324]
MASRGKGLVGYQNAPSMESHELRLLVLDYLIHSCFDETALDFVSDWPPIESEESASASASGKSNLDQSPSAIVARAISASYRQREESSTSQIDMDINSDTAEIDTITASNGLTHPLTQEPKDDAALASLTSGGDTARDALFSPSYFHNIKLRADLQRLVRAGRIQNAITICQERFPGVLSNEALHESYVTTTAANNGVNSNGSTNGASAPTGPLRPLASSSAFTSPVIQATSILPQAATALASTPATGANAWTSTASGLPRSSIPKLDSFERQPSFPLTSLSPIHLALNLQVQAFIECIRSTSTVASNGSGGASAMAFEGMSPAAPNGVASPSSSIHSQSTGSTATSAGILNRALSQAQSLFYLAGGANILPDPNERAGFLKELETVAGLMAYRDLEQAPRPVRVFLDLDRRERLAQALNSAILVVSGGSEHALLQQAARQTTLVWDTSREMVSTALQEESRAKPSRKASKQLDTLPASFSFPEPRSVSLYSTACSSLYSPPLVPRRLGAKVALLHEKL